MPEGEEEREGERAPEEGGEGEGGLEELAEEVVGGGPPCRWECGRCGREVVGGAEGGHEAVVPEEVVEHLEADGLWEGGEGSLEGRRVGGDAGDNVGNALGGEFLQVFAVVGHHAAVERHVEQGESRL